MINKEDKIKAIASAMVLNEVDVCGIAMFSAMDVAEEVLKTLNEQGYDIKEK